MYSKQRFSSSDYINHNACPEKPNPTWDDFSTDLLTKRRKKKQQNEDEQHQEDISVPLNISPVAASITSASASSKVFSQLTDADLFGDGNCQEFTTDESESNVKIDEVDDLPEDVHQRFQELLHYYESQPFMSIRIRQEDLDFLCFCRDLIFAENGRENIPWSDLTYHLIKEIEYYYESLVLRPCDELDRVDADHFNIPDRELIEVGIRYSGFPISIIQNYLNFRPYLPKYRGTLVSKINPEEEGNGELNYFIIWSRKGDDCSVRSHIDSIPADKTYSDEYCIIQERYHPKLNSFDSIENMKEKDESAATVNGTTSDTSPNQQDTLINIASYQSDNVSKPTSDSMANAVATAQSEDTAVENNKPSADTVENTAPRITSIEQDSSQHASERIHMTWTLMGFDPANESDRKRINGWIDKSEFTVEVRTASKLGKYAHILHQLCRRHF